MWQELLGAREETVNQISKSLHVWGKIVLLVGGGRLYMHRLCLEENATSNMGRYGGSKLEAGE